MVCLKNKAPLTPSSVTPWALSRFDDFQALHINQISWVHWSVVPFLNPISFQGPSCALLTFSPRSTSSHGTGTQCTPTKPPSTRNAATPVSTHAGNGPSAPVTPPPTPYSQTNPFFRQRRRLRRIRSRSHRLIHPSPLPGRPSRHRRRMHHRRPIRKFH